MSKKNIENKFSNEMDDYLNSNEISNKLEIKEYNELIELGKNLADKDFSKNSNKEAVFKKVQKNIKVYKGDNIMKKVNKIKRIAVVAASLAIVFTMMQTTFAQDFVEKIIKSIYLGNIIALQSEHPQAVMPPMPDKLKGKIFDKEGKPLETFSKEDVGKKIYTDKGEKIVGFSKDSEIVTEAQQRKIDKGRYLEVKNIDDFNKYTCFKVILPSYLPEGYKFDKAKLFKDEDGNVKESQKYIDLDFTNETTEKYIYMQQRFADEETAYEFSTDGEIEKVKINEVDAVICDGTSIDWETNGVLYGLSGRGEFGKSELIKIAESIK